MTHEELVERVIADGITEVCRAYANPEDHHKRDGAIAGFQVCRAKTPDELVELWRAAGAETQQLRREDDASPSHLKNYWKQRYKELQIEWVCNVVSVGRVNNGQPPLLAHLPTTGGAQKYAEIVGVRGGSS